MTTRAWLFSSLLVVGVSLHARPTVAFSQAELEAAMKLREIVAKEATKAPSLTYSQERKACLARLNWNSVIGVCSFVDKAGCRHVFGVGFANDNPMGQEIASMNARKNLAYVLAPTVVQTSHAGKGKSSSATRVDTTLRGVMTVYSDTVKMNDGTMRQVCVVEQANRITRHAQNSNVNQGNKEATPCR